MTLGMQDHCHLYTGTASDTTYPVYHDGYVPNLDTPLMIERAITGKAHAHRLFVAGEIKQFVAHTMRLKLLLAEKETIVALAGKQVYYIPNYHDDDDLPSYIVPCYLRVDGQQALNSVGSHWIVQVTFADNTI